MGLEQNNIKDTKLNTHLLNNKIESQLYFKAITYDSVNLSDGFWKEWQETNSNIALIHQYEMLEKVGTIDNFRLVAGLIKGFRKGLFYTDSDAHKWAEAAIRSLAHYNNEELKNKVSNYIELLTKAQDTDGYLFTYNQFYFPETKWYNLLIEHELYSAGHLIEAAIEHYRIKRNNRFLNIAIKLADLIVKRFSSASVSDIPGHQEIELALIKLYRITKKEKYLNVARNFLMKRGRNKFFFYQMIKEFISNSKRSKKVENQKISMGFKQIKEPKLMSDLSVDKIPFLQLRFNYLALTGAYLQAHKQLLKLKDPVGHSVRFAYYMTAAAMLYQETGDKKLLNVLEKLWEKTVRYHMYVTGGVGALPLIEGFGKKYSLSNKHAYCETCAAIGTTFWSWEMLLATGKAYYADIIERELYNAILVGISRNGKKYFYRNPLETNSDYERKEWYRTACCPSNISRTIGKVGEYIYSYKHNKLWFHQYISNKTSVNLGTESNKVEIIEKSYLPWDGKISIKLNNLSNPEAFKAFFRIPSWANNPSIKLNNKLYLIHTDKELNNSSTASGVEPFRSFFFVIEQDWKENNSIEITLPLSPKLIYSHNKVKANRNKVAISYGPLIYCIESTDNPEANIPNASIDLSAQLIVKNYALFKDNDEIKIIRAKNRDGQELVAIPYYLWGNRGKAAMQVWINKNE